MFSGHSFFLFIYLKNKVTEKDTQRKRGERTRESDSKAKTRAG